MYNTARVTRSKNALLDQTKKRKTDYSVASRSMSMREQRLRWYECIRGRESLRKVGIRFRGTKKTSERSPEEKLEGSHQERSRQSRRHGRRCSWYAEVATMTVRVRSGEQGEEENEQEEEEEETVACSKPLQFWAFWGTVGTLTWFGDVNGIVAPFSTSC